MNINISKKGQMSVEMMIIIGVLILVAVIVASLLIGSSENAIDNTEQVNKQVSGAVDGFSDQLKRYNAGEDILLAPIDGGADFYAYISSPNEGQQIGLDQEINFSANYGSYEGSITCEWTYEGTVESTNCSGFTISDPDAYFGGVGIYDFNFSITDSQETLNRSVTFEIINTNPCNNNTVCEAGIGETINNCPNDCSVCGNNTLEGLEVCDNDQYCTVEKSGITYDGVRLCINDCTQLSACTTAMHCGDDECTDGETIDNCSNDCSDCGNTTVEGDEVCDVAGATSTQSCTIEAANGITYSGTQDCLGDCSGYGVCNLTEECGDFTINGSPEEACDGYSQDCNVTNLNGLKYPGTQDCLSDCTAYETCTSVESCGDNILNGYDEVCDGNTNVSCTVTDGIFEYPGTQDCLGDCTGYTTCTTSMSCGDTICNGNETETTCAQDCTECGNGNVEFGETCDTSGSTSTQTCTYTNPDGLTYSGTQDCLNDCSGYDTCSSTEYCGDGTINGYDEVCDGGNQSCPATVDGIDYPGTQDCLFDCTAYESTCSTSMSCGDNTCNGGETLDNCAEDCYVVGDGICSDPYETHDESPNDCPLICNFDGMSNVVDVDGGFPGCAVKTDGTVKCWGAGYYELFGPDGPLSSDFPIEVQGISDATDISVGRWYACAITETKEVKCWARNRYGQLGDGTRINNSTPSKAIGVTDIIDISAGFFGTVCAAQSSASNGEVYCWGRNNVGQTGVGYTSDYVLTPTKISTVAGLLNNVVDVAVGSSHSCALLSDGRVTCWGSDDYGQLGISSSNDSTATPGNFVYGILNATKISSYGNNTCALLDDGQIKCWGRNHYGQLGSGTTSISKHTPVGVKNISNAIDIGVGSHSACALISDGSVKCWGNNSYGQLGNNSTVHSNTPVNVKGITNASKIRLGSNKSFALLSNNELLSWGSNYKGGLGDGTQDDRHTPVNVIENPVLDIGDTGPAGGTVFYEKAEYDNCWKYLEVESSLRSKSTWGCSSLIGTDSAIGTGLENTKKIVDNCSLSSYAVKTCNDSTLGGKSDWFLGSQDEYFEMYNSGIGSLLFSSTNHVQTSTEVDDLQYKTMSLAWGSEVFASKSQGAYPYVCIRRF